MVDDLEHALTGQVLDDGWVIGKRRVKCAGATGSCHSLGFIGVHPDGRKAYIKMMDPTVDPTLEGREQLEELQRRLSVFLYEGDLMDKCLTRKIRRVVRAIGQGSVRVEGFHNDIHYILLELADNDLREFSANEQALNVALKLRIAHQVSLALEALHFNQIAHQDLKPSNVLMFNETTAKVGDLGHAHDRSVSRPGGLFLSTPGQIQVVDSGNRSCQSDI